MKELTEQQRRNQVAALAAIQKYAKKWADVPKKDEHIYQWKRIAKCIEVAARDGLHGLPIDLND